MTERNSRHLNLLKTLGKLQLSRTSFVNFTRSVPPNKSLSPIGLVFCETLYRPICAFPKHVQTIGFTTVGLQSWCRNISKMIKRNVSPFSIKFRENLFKFCHYGELSVDWWGDFYLSIRQQHTQFKMSIHWSSPTLKPLIGKVNNINYRLSKGEIF